MHKCICVHMCIYEYICVHVFECTHTYLYVYVCMYVCMYVCVYVCMYIFFLYYTANILASQRPSRLIGSAASMSWALSMSMGALRGLRGMSSVVQRPAPSWQWVFVATELSGCGLVLRHKRTRCPQAKLTGVITVDARLSWVAKKAAKVEEEEEAAGRTFFLSEHRALSLCPRSSQPSVMALTALTAAADFAHRTAETRTRLRIVR